MVATNFASHFGTGTELRGRAVALVRLSKIVDYLVDNVSSDRLSDLKRVVNDKACCRIRGLGESQGRKPREPGYQRLRNRGDFCSTAHFRRMPPITSCMSMPLLLSIQAAMKSGPAQVLPV